MTDIRDERQADIASIRRVNGAALLSLIAVEEKDVIGDVMFSPVTIGQVTGAGLGPMAVVPERQRQGIGGQEFSTVA